MKPCTDLFFPCENPVMLSFPWVDIRCRLAIWKCITICISINLIIKTVQIEIGATPSTWEAAIICWKVQLLCAKKMAALVTTIDYANIEILKDTFLGIDIGIPWHICFYLLFNVSLLLIAVEPVWFLCIAWFLVGNWLTKECSSLTNVVCKNGIQQTTTTT